MAVSSEQTAMPNETPKLRFGGLQANPPYNPCTLRVNYAGSNQWALPSAGANPQFGDNQTGSQFGQLFYTELVGTAYNNIPNTANFTNEQAYAYWLGTEYAPNPDNAWVFDTVYGVQDYSYYKDDQLYAWAVSPGQVPAVPVPGAVWLFGIGLLGFLGLKRRWHAGCRSFG